MPTIESVRLIMEVLAIASLLAAIFILVKEREKIPAGQSSFESWGKKELFLIFLVNVFSPIVSGAVLYYGLRRRWPTKAKIANHFSYVGLVLYLLLAYLLANSLQR
jgi:hypothetical protein